MDYYLKVLGNTASNKECLGHWIIKVIVFIQLKFELMVLILCFYEPIGSIFYIFGF